MYRYNVMHSCEVQPAYGSIKEVKKSVTVSSLTPSEVGIQWSSDFHLNFDLLLPIVTVSRHCLFTIIPRIST